MPHVCMSAGTRARLWALQCTVIQYYARPFGTLLMLMQCFCAQALNLGLAYIVAQVLGGIVGAAAAFTSLPGFIYFTPCGVS